MLAPTDCACSAALRNELCRLCARPFCRSDAHAEPQTGEVLYNATSTDGLATDPIMPICGKSLPRISGFSWPFPFPFSLYSNCLSMHIWTGQVGHCVTPCPSDAFCVTPWPLIFTGDLSFFHRSFSQLVLFRTHLEACRVGEATNPGPVDWHFAIINPTAVSCETTRLLQLGDTIAVSETSATISVQRPEARKQKASWLWGHPVENHKASSTQDGLWQGDGESDSCHVIPAIPPESPCPLHGIRHVDSWKRMSRLEPSLYESL